MYDKNFLHALNFTLSQEGGYNNDPDDFGKITYKGITQKTYDYYVKKYGKKHKNVSQLSNDEIMEFFYHEFWKESGADKIRNSVKATILFDSAVLLGTQTAKSLYNKSNGNMNKFLDYRENYHKKVIQKYPKQKKYEQGWMNRVNDLRDIADKYETLSNALTEEISAKKNTAERQFLSQNFYKNEFIQSIDKEKFTDEILDNKKLNAMEFITDKDTKIDYYTKRIYESMQKSSSKNTIDKDAPKITGETLKNMLDTQYQKLKDYTNKIYMESEAINKRFTGNIPKDYKNPHLENDRIFTKEEIDKMPRREYQKNEKAIRYQRKTIGIPTKSQAEKTASKKGSGMVLVSGYTTSDGRKVGDYFRSYPRE